MIQFPYGPDEGSTRGVANVGDALSSEDVMEKTTITIDGMSCSGCVSKVQNALRAVPGTHVEAVSVGSATVSYDASLASPTTLAQAIRDAGYEPHDGQVPMTAGAKRTSGGCCG